jgi:GMP synthase-like glutamine amidotransferase
MLNTDTPVPNVYSKCGTYGNIFDRLLRAAAQRIGQGIGVESEDFDVVRGEYPASFSKFDAILITGSAASSYDKAEWIHKLDRCIRDVYEKHPEVRIFGSCFGHQIVCQSLLKEYGVVVEKDPNGWELGVREIQLKDEFYRRLGGLESQGFDNHNRPPTPERESLTDKSDQVPGSLRLQFVHADHVRVPSLHALPEGWIIVGSTQHCAVQGVYEPNRVLTYQGHFEFDRFINTETLKVFGASWKSGVLEQAIKAIDADDDAELAADMVMRFLMEANNRKGELIASGGLLTPPGEPS